MILLQTLGGTLVSLSQISRGYLACFGKHHESRSVFNPVWYAQNVFRGPSFGSAFFQRRTFWIYGHAYEPEASNWCFSATSGDFLRHSGNTSVSWRGHAICLRSRQTTLHQHISRYLMDNHITGLEVLRDQWTKLIHTDFNSDFCAYWCTSYLKQLH